MTAPEDAAPDAATPRLSRPDDGAHAPSNGTTDVSIVEVRHSEALTAFEAAAEDAIEKVVAPFAEIFATLHAVSLGDLATSEAVPELDQVDREERLKAMQMVQVFVMAAGHPEVLRAAGTLTYRVVRDGPRAVETAVSLSESATRSARLARANLPKASAQSRKLISQVGRTAAKHQGKLGLAAFAIGTFTLAMAWRADNAERRAREEAQARRPLLDAEASRRAAMMDDLARQRLLAEVERIEEATQVLTRLADIGVGRMAAFRALVAGNDDYATYPQPDRLAVAELAGLAEVLVAVIAGPEADERVPVPSNSSDEKGALLAAQALLDRLQPARGTAGTDAAVVVAWAAGMVNSATQRDQLEHLLEQPEYLERLAKRCGNARQGVQDGFFFEWFHELSFNLDAISKDSDQRARMTERLGRPHDPADIVVQAAAGDATRQVQAKVVTSKSQRVGPKNGLSDPKYAGMDLLVPKDHVHETHEFIDKVLDRPAANLFADGYQDAKTRITDTIESGEISSDPITTGELTAIAQNPDNFIQRLVRGTRRDHALSAGFAAGGAATFMSLSADITHHLLSDGHLDGFNWAQAGVSAARTGVASAIAGAGGSYLQTGAQLAVNDGSANWLQASMAHGDHGPALTRAAVDVAAIAHGFATGRLTAVEAAEAVAETIIESAAIWACTALARRLIPDAEVAAMVGGIVGQVGTQVVVQGLRTAWLGRDPSASWDAAYAALLDDTAALELACAAERQELATISETCRARFHDEVAPALSRLDSDYDSANAGSSVMGKAVPSALGDLAAIAGHFGSAPLFSDLDAFDAFMSDPATTLVLNLGPR